MTAFLIVALTAFLAAGLTLYSGFGLGTMLLPVFALFFPAEMAVVATALVHGANNVFKVSLLGRFADKEVVLKFGLPAIAAAILGALALGRDSERLAVLALSAGFATPALLGTDDLVPLFGYLAHTRMALLC